jgi:hypothetical protein
MKLTAYFMDIMIQSTKQVRVYNTKNEGYYKSGKQEM